MMLHEGYFAHQAPRKRGLLFGPLKGSNGYSVLSRCFRLPVTGSLPKPLPPPGEGFPL